MDHGLWMKFNSRRTAAAAAAGRRTFLKSVKKVRLSLLFPKLLFMISSRIKFLIEVIVHHHQLLINHCVKQEQWRDTPAMFSYKKKQHQNIQG